MKKVLMLVVVLALFVSPALSEAIDFTSMSLDELLVMRQSIEDEIYSRLQEGSGTIWVGAYHVGKDIKAGSYVLSGIENTIIVHVYESEEDFANHKTSTNDFVSTTGYYLSVKEGMVIEVLIGNGYIVPASATYKP